MAERLDKPARDDIVAIQALRWVAASLVVWGHSEHELVKVAGRHHRALTFDRPIEFGVGVDIFFLISGFLIFLVSRDLFGRPGAAGDFLRRRAIRIIPLYWLATALMLVATLAVPSLLNHGVLGAREVLSSFAMIAAPGPDGGVFPLLASGWTLNLEFYFYALFAVALLSGRRVAVPGLLAWLVLSVAADQLWHRSPWWLDFYAQPIVLEFGAGLVLCLVHGSGVRLTPAVSVAGVAAAVALHLGLQLTVAHPPRILGNGVPAMILFVSTVFARGWSLPPRFAGSLRLMGDASYALYLTSPFAINFAVEVLTRAGLHAVPALLVSAYATSLGVAVLVHLHVERRLVRFCRLRFGRDAASRHALPDRSRGPEVVAT